MAITKKYWTLAQIIAKVEADLNLEDEGFISESEMLGYINEAIDEAETEVHGIYEDYFLSKETLTLVSGTSEYSLPTTVFAHKIRRVTYRNGARTYTVKRIRDWKKFEQYELDKVGGAQSEAEYQYFLMNSTVGDPKFLFSPEVSESGAYITVWFLRQANRLEVDADKMDIPEAANFVIQYVKMRCYEKERHANLEKAMSDVEKERTILTGILASMVPDADNEIEMDLSAYQEMN